MLAETSDSSLAREGLCFNQCPASLVSHGHGDMRLAEGERFRRKPGGFSSVGSWRKNDRLYVEAGRGLQLSSPATICRVLHRGLVRRVPFFFLHKSVKWQNQARFSTHKYCENGN